MEPNPFALSGASSRSTVVSCHSCFLDTCTCCTALCPPFAQFHQDFLFVFCFFPLHNFELWATPSLHPGYAIKFSLRISLPISEPSFCSGTKCLHPEQRDSELSAPVHFSPHLTAPEDIFYNVCGCIIELKQSSILRLTSFFFFFLRGELEN